MQRFINMNEFIKIKCNCLLSTELVFTVFYLNIHIFFADCTFFHAKVILSVNDAGSCYLVNLCRFWLMYVEMFTIQS